MLRDYKISLSLLTVALIIYTALVLLNSSRRHAERTFSVKAASSSPADAGASAAASTP